jgi:NAD(P)-dependent dehydrogenase (short-subunit alcohol dehydrogenase family)
MSVVSLNIARLFDVSGKVAIVTGGSRGIGKMMARGLVENGVRTYIVARDAEICRATAEELSKLGTCIALQGDLGTMDGVKSVAAALAAKEDKLHILINNAGIWGGAKFEDYEPDVFDNVFAINTRAPFFLTQALLPQLRAAASAMDPARVINMSSGAGLRPFGPSNYSYGGSKAAEIHLTQRLALGLAGEHINVNAMTPGRVMTPMLAAFIDDTGQDPASNIPSGRLTGADEMAGATLYLCSRAGANVTGICLNVDGGQSIWVG